MKSILANNSRTGRVSQIFPNPDLYKTMTEDEVMAHVTARNKEVGEIPCETESERNECLAKYAALHPGQPAIELPPIGEHLIIDEADLPETLGQDSYFEAWEINDGVASVNMTKARAIHLVAIRRVRDAELVKKDVPFMRAVEDADTDAQATIKTEKQVLRDLPATFDITTDAGTPELLKAKWPVELPARE